MDRPHQPEPIVATVHVTPDERRRLFAAHYRLHHNATAAAIAAGLSSRTAKQTGARMLSHVDVQQLLAAGERRERQIVARVARKLEVTRETIIEELARIGFSDIRRIVDWNCVDVDLEGPEDNLEPQPHGGALRRRRVLHVNQVRLRDSDEIDDDTAAAISEVTYTASGGLRVKLHDKRAALVSLGQTIGLFNDDGAAPTTVNFTIIGLYPEGKRERTDPKQVEGSHAFRPRRPEGTR